jgi:hypothetical protein
MERSPQRKEQCMKEVERKDTTAIPGGINIPGSGVLITEPVPPCFPPLPGVPESPTVPNVPTVERVPS